MNSFTMALSQYKQFTMPKPLPPQVKFSRSATVCSAKCTDRPAYLSLLLTTVYLNQVIFVHICTRCHYPTLVTLAMEAAWSLHLNFPLLDPNLTFLEGNLWHIATELYCKLNWNHISALCCSMVQPTSCLTWTSVNIKRYILMCHFKDNPDNKWYITKHTANTEVILVKTFIFTKTLSQHWCASVFYMDKQHRKGSSKVQFLVFNLIIWIFNSFNSTWCTFLQFPLVSIEVLKQANANARM